MRRAAVAVLIVGWMFWGMISRLDQQPVAVAADLNMAANSVKAAKPGTKTVTYGGYAVSVPGSWPVYDLNKDPRRCVRYNVHAVYLGTPGPDQDCPPDLVGRVDTISIGPGPQAAPAAPKAPGDRRAPAQTGRAAQAGQQAPAPGKIVQDPDLHEPALAMPATSPRIGATRTHRVYAESPRYAITPTG